MRGDTYIERWSLENRTQGANDDRLIKDDIGCFRKSHFKSRLFKKAISAELTSSAFSCCVQCPQSGKMIVC